MKDKIIDTNTEIEKPILNPVKTKKERIEHIETAIENDIKKDKKEENVQYMDNQNKSELSRSMELLHNPERIESATILTNRQVLALDVINYLAQVYNIKFFKHFMDTFPRYRISGDDGRGRKELIEIANALRVEQDREHQKLLDVLQRR